MTGRERIRALMRGERADRTAFWLGNPHESTWPLLHTHFKTRQSEEIRRILNDDLRWINASTAYRHPENVGMFKGADPGRAFGEDADARRIEEYEWPDLGLLDFSDVLQELNAAGDAFRASGFWCPFFHDLADLFGMETYFFLMITRPDVVHDVTRRVVDFYLEANRRLFRTAGDRIDAFFMGNDFGTQLDLLVGPKQMEEFVFPYLKVLIQQAHECGLPVILHSCGAIHRIIPRLLDLGIDALYPLQAKANLMDAQTLSSSFKGRLLFIGGIDTQDLLVRATPDQVKAEVRRVRRLLGPRLVISPSHEALLPNVPPQNIEAMAEAAQEPDQE